MFSRVLKIILVFILNLWFLFSVVVSAAFDLGDIKLVYHPGPDSNNSVPYNLSDATKILQHEQFTQNDTHFYLHGFHETQNSESIHLIVDAYMKRKTVNLVTVDWAVAAAGNYLSAAFSNIEVLSLALADTLLELYDAGLDRKSVTIVAHSLGAQLAGKTGRQIIKKSNNTVKIYRMVALDAAFPFFFDLFLTQTVNKNDAEFLQAIHTDIGTYGQPSEFGHVDFWPNGGRQGQPGCPQGLIIPLSDDDLCSHQRSFQFWAESVATLTEPKFMAFPSSNYHQFLVHGIENLKDEAIEMGFNCPMSARGNYYLKTNSQPPFAMGFNGY